MIIDLDQSRYYLSLGNFFFPKDFENYIEYALNMFKSN